MSVISRVPCRAWSRGITDAIARADRNNTDTLRELIEVGRKAALKIDKLERRLTQATKR